jgi:hypothetical protein
MSISSSFHSRKLRAKLCRPTWGSVGEANPVRVRSKPRLLSTELRKALENASFELRYRSPPAKRCCVGGPTGAAGYRRRIDSAGGNIVPLDEWALRKTCADACAPERQGRDQPFANPVSERRQSLDSCANSACAYPWTISARASRARAIFRGVGREASKIRC